MTRREASKLTADQALLVGGLRQASEQRRQLDLIVKRLIGAAVREGVAQTRIADAAGISQAHVSRIAAESKRARTGQGRRSARTGGNSGEPV